MTDPRERGHSVDPAAPELLVLVEQVAHDAHPSFYFRRIEQRIHPNYSWFAVSEDKKGDNILNAFQYARDHWQPWIGVMTLWTVLYPTWTPQREEDWWADHQRRPLRAPGVVSLLKAHSAGLFS